MVYLIICFKLPSGKFGDTACICRQFPNNLELRNHISECILEKTGEYFKPTEIVIVNIIRLTEEEYNLYKTK